MPLDVERLAYKPFEYPWAYEAWETQQQIHWLPKEVPLAEDVRDWQRNLTPSEKNLLTQIFRLFTASDIEVGNCYSRYYMQIFKPTEILMMLTAFSNSETVHIASYSHLLDTIGMPEVEYAAFLDYKEMQDKHDFMREFRGNDPKSVALTLAAFGAFTEGLQLFASFAILLNFSRFNKMKGMGQIVTWSARDETLHAVNIIKLFHTYLGEHPEVDREELATELTAMCKQVVETEDRFIDLSFEQGDVEGITKAQVKQYIRYMADIRLTMLGLDGIYNVPNNPLPWMDSILNGIEHAAFFEQRSTEYSKASTEGDWGDVFPDQDHIQREVVTDGAV